MNELLQQLDRAATPRLFPELDPEFRAPALWVRAYQALATTTPATPVGLAISRPDGTTFRHDTRILPWSEATAAATHRYIERLLKQLLWQKGGSRIRISGCAPLVARLAAEYAPGGARAFDAEIIGIRIFGEPLQIIACQPDELPAPCEPSLAVGGHWDGCRIGFDLGGSDRKCAAVIDGKTVFSEEVPWAPIREPDWNYHVKGIEDSLQRAAAHLPRVDAIGGSTAGIVINSEIRVASLFRAVPLADFDRHVRNLFGTIAKKWNVPMVVMNDGEVTALAGAMGLHDHPVLGMAFGTSLAGGYCTPQGSLTSWLNELAFVPVDYRLQDAPRDEWSGDRGCGALYLSQQGAGRLALQAGLPLDDLPLPERLAATQEHLARGDARARKVFASLGRYLGYTVAHQHDFFELKRVLLLGRVTSGDAGTILLEEANRVLREEFPAIAGRVTLSMPNETEKRHGQAMVAASLPVLR
jgi:predicted NBD/HSP70 family sugar kinase